MSSILVCALDEALAIVEEEGLEARWARHERNHRVFIDALKTAGLTVLPPEGERLWTLNAVRIPDDRIDDAAVRKQLLEEFSIEIGAGLGPLAGKLARRADGRKLNAPTHRLTTGGAGGRDGRAGASQDDGVTSG